MTLVLVSVAAVVFALLAALFHTVSERRRQRWTREQWERRERLLDRKPSP